ncbi:MAG TPA: hypothetical protein VIA62_06340 [Thermoanaerobaculia bacterium]|jgi:hypothetical protein|nr:hypothetical protein [Thermoanaerobaculia bacterium]
MRAKKALLVGTFALFVATTSYASVHHPRTHPRIHHRVYDRTVDVAASPLPPLPTLDHVRVVNSADHPSRHHGLRGVVERAHRAHMRLRAKIYRDLFSH